MQKEDKSAETKQLPESQLSGYKPSLQRHVDVNRNYLYTSIRVRVFLEDVERDLIIKVRNNDLAAKDICTAIAIHLRIPENYTSMFRLWTFGKDIELQLDPEQKMADLLIKWNIVMLQYTHYTEAATATNLVNRYYFVYKRAAILSRKIDEKAMESSIVTQLLYGEAKRNYLNGRYLISPEDEYKMAAFQLFNRYGICVEKKLRKLDENPSIILGVLPARYKITEITKTKIVEEYQALPKYFDAQLGFLSCMISLPSYGSCFFPVCEERPPLGYFEHRLQRWMIGVNDLGMVILDPMKKRCIQTFIWETTQWEYSPVDITITSNGVNPDKPEKIKLLSPQSPIIDNVATRAKYIWAKEVLKENMNYIHNEISAESDGEAIAGTSKATARFEEHIFDENIEKKFTSTSQKTKKTKEQITLKYIWEMIKSPMMIKKPGDIPYDIDDGMSNVGSRQDLNFV